MNKIEEIFTAWGISFNPNEVQSELATSRIEICNMCEYKKNNLLINTCSVCGCSLKAKVFSPIKGACPKGKWDEVDNINLPNPPKRNLRFICAQPATIYYVWQVEVMLNNFIKMGINPNDIDIVCWKKNGIIPEEWSKLANSYPARFFFYDDLRETKDYISSIRPNILKQHWENYPELKDETIFYHDSDIIFTKRITEWITDDMINDENWYGSDTRWYIGHDYIISKGDDILSEMCKIVDIDKDLVKQNELNSIGAQYLMKGIDYNFWDNVEKDCENLFREINLLSNSKKLIEPTYHELQIWCADMWAVLWNGWKLGHNTISDNKFDFSWATGNVEEYQRCNIMHNAGVVNSTSGYFYKAEYMNELPYNKNLQIKKDTASWYYWDEIQETAKKSVLI